MRTDTPTPIRLEDYRPSPFAVDEIALQFDLDPQRTVVAAVSKVRRVGAAGSDMVLNGVGFELTHLAIDGVTLTADRYVKTDEHLRLIAPPDQFALSVTSVLNPSANTGLEGLYLSGGRLCTQCEAEGFRKITYAQDRPDSLSRYTVTLNANKAQFPTLLSNGDLVSTTDLPDGRHQAVWRDPHKKPSYLFAVVAGAFDTRTDSFTTASGRTVTLGIHVDPGDGARTAYAMDALKRSMAWDERAFGREYDLDVYNIVAVRDFNFGAMENKGLNIFNSMYILADQDTATDTDFEGIEAVVGHEYFHNWTGNRITCRDWFQLSLKEGLTVFREQEFCADERSRPVQRIKDVRRLRARQFVEDSGPLAHSVRPDQYVAIDNFYTATVYEKGAEIIRLLKRIIGAEAFAKGLALYFDRHDGQAVTLEDILACFAEASGQDLSGILRWYTQAGTPKVTARGSYDAQSHRYTLQLSQSQAPTPGQTEKLPLPIPLQIGFVAQTGALLAPRLEGAELAREEHLVVLSEAHQTLVFEGMAMPPIPSLLRDFTAPVVLDDGLSEADRLVLMSHDPDPFTRWEAGQVAARTLILREVAEPGQPFTQLIAGLERALQRAKADLAFAALALRLPDLTELIQASASPDVDALDAARLRLKGAVAKALEPQLRAIASPAPEGPFSADAAAAGARALRITALDLLSALGAEAAPVIAEVFAGADNMTVEINALEALGHSGSPDWQQALDSFYARWKDTPLALDKWFSAQAASSRADVLTRLAALRQSPDFTVSNPNRVRALAAAFPARNPRAFHAADGGGYRFLADLVADIDPLNPALAARLLTGFESWRRFDLGRQGHARAALEGLLNRPTVSKNSAEMLSRMLS